MNRIAIFAAAMLTASPALAASDGVSAGGAVGALTVLGVLIGGYFLPTIIAIIRKHPNVVAILLINLLLGWTFIGWVAALIWSVISLASRERVIYVEHDRR